MLLFFFHVGGQGGRGKGGWREGDHSGLVTLLVNPNKASWKYYLVCRRFLIECSSSSSGHLQGGGLPYQPGGTPPATWSFPPLSVWILEVELGQPLHRWPEQRADRSLYVPKRSLLFCLPCGFSASSARSALSPRKGSGGAFTGPTGGLSGPALKTSLVLPEVFSLLGLLPIGYLKVWFLTRGPHDPHDTTVPFRSILLNPGLHLWGLGTAVQHKARADLRALASPLQTGQDQSFSSSSAHGNGWRVFEKPLHVPDPRDSVAMVL